MKLFDEMRKTTKSTAFKKSSYVSILTVAVLAIVIVINVIVGALPSNAMEIDVSENQMYQIGETTKKVLNEVSNPVEIIVLADESNVDSRISRFLGLYDNYSKQISVTYIDPVKHPSALTTYDTTSNHIVIKCEAMDKQKTISFDDILEYDETYYMYYGEKKETAFDGEGEITSAIDYVISENTEIVYELTGHGETSLNATLVDKINRSNVTVKSWSLLMDGTEIPDDCSTLVINVPDSDISEEELTSLREYCERGGNIVYVVNGEFETMPNLEALMADYGVSTTHGYVGDQKRYYQYYRSVFAFFPTYSSGNVTSGFNADSNLTLLINPTDLEVEKLDDVTTDAFLKTSSSGIYTKGDSDDYEEGTFTVAVSAKKTEDSDSAISSTLTVFGCSAITDSSLMDSSLTNADIFLNSITQYYAAVDNISIDAVSLEITYNTMTNTGIVIAIIAIFMVAMIVTGIVVWNLRRKL